MAVLHIAKMDIDLYCGTNPQCRPRDTTPVQKEALKHALFALRWLHDAWPENDRIKYSWLCEYSGVEPEDARESFLSQWSGLPRFERLCNLYREWLAMEAQARIDRELTEHQQYMAKFAPKLDVVERAKIAYESIAAVGEFALIYTDVFRWSSQHGVDPAHLFASKQVRLAEKRMVPLLAACYSHLLVCGYMARDVGAAMGVHPRDVSNTVRAYRYAKRVYRTGKQDRMFWVPYEKFVAPDWARRVQRKNPES
jgi:hypothetical protein